MDLYVLDADAFISVHQHFPVGLRRLRKAIKDGHLRVPEGVLRELGRGTDRLGRLVRGWVSTHSDVLVMIGQSTILQAELTRIEQTYGERVKVGQKEYPGFWSSPAGRKAIDGQVVATAKVLHATVVSDDRAVRFACLLENIPCIAWSEFARRMNMVPPTLPGLD